MFIDVNASTGHWPFQIFPFQDCAGLNDHLASHDIEKALVSHLGTVFYPDADHYNRQLLKEAAGNAAIIPVPVLNLGIPGWQDRLAEYRENWDLKTVKIIPPYHLYTLKSQAVTDLVQQLLELDLPLLLQLRLEDERNQYLGLTIQGVPADDVIEFNQQFPDLKVVCLNAYLPDAIHMAEKTTANMGFDISFTERSNTVDTLTETIPAERLFFGSHTPILYTMSATMKVQYCTRDEETKSGIASGNATEWFGI